MRKKVEMLKNHTCFLAYFINVNTLLSDNLTVNRYFALCRDFKQVKASQERTFTRTRWSYHNNDLAVRDMFVNAFENL